MSTVLPSIGRRSWVPFVVLLTALSLTAVVATYVAWMARMQNRVAFDEAIEHVEDTLDARIATGITLLRGGAGLFAAEPHLSREAFRAYVDRLELQRQYPGVQGIGFSQRVRVEERRPLVQRLRKEGFKTFDVWPPDPRPEYHAILYLEPWDRRNTAALGYDMSSDPVRRRAMERARDFAVPSASGKVELVQEIDRVKQPGFLIYVPVYAGGAVPATIEARRARLLGFVYSPYRAGDFLRHLFRNAAELGVNFEIYDGQSTHEPDLLHRVEWPSGAERRPVWQPRFTATRPIAIAGRTWTIRFASRPELEASSGTTLVPVILVTGVLISLVLFVLTWLETTARRDAERTSADLQRSQAALRESDVRFRRLMESNIVGITIGDFQGRVLEANDEFLRLIGYTREELERGEVNVFDVTPPEQRERSRQAMDEMRRAGRHAPFTKEYVRKDGTRVPVLVATVALGGPEELGMGFVADLSEQRRAEERIQASLREKEILLKEIHHRVKNNLQIISSLLSLQSSYIADPEALSLFKESQNRIRSMALVHEKLYESKDLSRIDVADYLESLVAQIRRSYSLKVGVSIEVEAEPISLSIDTAIPCALIVNELVANALEHGFPEGRTGEIRVVLKTEPDGRYQLTIEDEGIGLPPGLQIEQAETLGLRLVHALVEQLGGELTVRREGGAGFTIRFAEIYRKQRV